ncbi:hypothetical protein Tsubulata_020391 [Turnera subulata]|uniref:Subtilisin-like protease n=1 Tax=Turnera subulata TaxID=218843 RepID=A0A9Q0FJ31_9ROSI|nr:hypothetical protein Tsubulata_020391 [Turnera subulata]
MSLDDDDAKESIVYSYTKYFNAFAAKLTKVEARELSRHDKVLSVFPNRYHKLHTTKSWDFIGLPYTAKRNFKTERNIVVGLLDTGITPQSASFNDNGFDPPPKTWRGTCGHFANFSGCNNKLVGARYFKLDGNPDPNDILSPIDVDGHGTHTSSTLAGNEVPDASLYGLARGAARGGVPSARVAMYKVCWASSGCSDMDLLAAFEAAIHDGVDLISISIGGENANYVSDALAIGTFHAMKNGIITVASAGNDGPSSATVGNTAPWILTVAASGIDREFRSKVKLGNGITVSGVGVNTFEPKEKLYPLVSGADAAKNSGTKENARYCLDGSMDPDKVKGKVVYCQLGMWGVDSIVKGIGGKGIILQSGQYLDAAQIFMAPGTMVNVTVGEAIDEYIHSSKSSPSAVISRSQEVKVPAPFIASFSSRGPNPGSDRVLKPDIAAPGIDILASYTPLNSLTGLKGDTQYSEFSLMSGTSMACPHVAGVAAYVKSFHPNWTPAAIKSAILTTAKPMSSRVNGDAEFAYGAGQINPQRARNPGLVYDMDAMFYIQFLCREGYNGSSLAVLVGSKSINCSKLLPGLGYDALNYPTMQLSVKNDQEPTVAVFRRTVTNVGPSPSIFNATIKAPKGVEIVVKPMSLSFTRPSQKLTFKVVVKAKPLSSPQILSVTATMILRISLLLLALLATSSTASMDKRMYVVHMDKAKTQDSYENMINSLTESSTQEQEEDQETTSPKIIYVYERAISGFAAKLSTKQVLCRYRGHGRSTFPCTLAGTKFSPENCNKKLIGARAFFKGYEAVAGRINETVDYRSPRDSQGHGTHTAATAAGSFVEDASLFGLAKGSAAGMKYTARIAAYKVCWRLGCTNADLLAAIDQAVADGVDVLSLSLGGVAKPFYSDNVAIASFGATQNGVFVSCSAGNSGPSSSTVDNNAPWIMTVAASYTDRSFPTTVKLGNGQTFEGASLYSGKATRQLPLVYGATAGGPGAQYCISGSLKKKLVKGKIVVCERGLNGRAQKGEQVKMAGGAGMLVINTDKEGEELFADPHILPATSLGASAGKVVKKYMNSTKKPTASIEFRGTAYGLPAPKVAAFSSRGPSSVGPDVIKPDVTAPGVNILAAWPPMVSPTMLKSDNRSVPYNIISGTSMSCPHVTGLAALLKSAHKDWSPAAIKSALMTTAYVLDSQKAPIPDVGSNNSAPATPFAFGSGHVDPESASDPGLIYDITTEDYLNYLCSLNYTASQVAQVSGKNYTCPDNTTLQPGDLNYPSFAVNFIRSGKSNTMTFKRTVTNVGSPSCAYTVQVEEPSGVSVTLEPKMLSFENSGQQLTYKVSFVGLGGQHTRGSSSFGSIVWVSGTYRVRSPIAVTWQ